MWRVLIGIVCGVVLGLGGGYVAFGRDNREKVTTCTHGSTGRIDLSTGQPAQQTTCVTR